MTTRADFWLGRGVTSSWLGSVAYNGQIEVMPASLRFAGQQHGFVEAVHRLLKTDVATRPDQGWPWPWDTSALTDYAYAFVRDRVYASYFGSPWFEAADGLPDDPDGIEGPSPIFPSMAKRRRVVLTGPRSGRVTLAG